MTTLKGLCMTCNCNCARSAHAAAEDSAVAFLIDEELKESITVYTHAHVRP